MSSVVVPPDTDSNTKPTDSAPAPDADDEPQNALTQKFTEKEWAALKEFRVRVPPHNYAHAHASFIAHLTFVPFFFSATSPRYTRKVL
jgi:hypothetical protein